MKTVKPFIVDEMRIKASERIHSMFKSAIVICIKYKNTFAEGYCQYKDGTPAFFSVWYRDLLIQPVVNVQQESQHDRAKRYINQMV